ncbi:MAG: 30S ribosomal protein S3ae, partial [archaeon]|nr:30S ribosomal protein S3ae [archaeon]
MVENKGKKRKRASAKRTVDKWKRKKWFKVYSSKEFDQKEIAETPAEKEKTIPGRSIKANLGDLTGERQKRHITITFKITEVKGQQAYTEIVKHEASHGYINRLVRRKSSKIEAVQTVVTKDNRKVKVKTLALSQRKLDRRQEMAIRKGIVESVEISAAKNDFSPFIQLVVFGVLASKLFKDLKKVAPLKRV